MKKDKQKKIVDQLLADRNKPVLKELMRKSFYWFFYIGFHEDMKYKIAPFQKEIFSLVSDQSIETLVIMAARGLGKTTIITQFFPLYAIFGSMQKKYVLICSQTMDQSQQILKNIKDLLENNYMIRSIFGKFNEEFPQGEWNSQSIVLPKYGARITVSSVGKGKRGLLHGSSRVDLVLLDDIEDSDSTRSLKTRNKTYQWITREIMPLGDRKTKYIFVGNFLHRDSALMRIINGISPGDKVRVFKKYPIVKEDGTPMWPGKYPTLQDVENEHKRINDEVAWQLEYMLKDFVVRGKIINKEDIHYYDSIPSSSGSDGNFVFVASAVDPAVTVNDHSDYTAIVSADVFGNRASLKIYIRPEMINKKVYFAEAKEIMMAIAESRINMRKQYLVIENLAFQDIFRQEIEDRKEKENIHNLNVRGFSSRVAKENRLFSIAYAIRNGTILFPRNMPAEFVSQLLDPETEEHDDLTDAFAMLCLEIISIDKEYKEPRIRFLGD